MANRRARERGNVFFMILIGIVLFAAVTAAVVSTSRGGGKSISDEKARLIAGKILRYANQIQGGVDLLQRNGVSEVDIRFAHPSLSASYGTISTNPTNQVFTEEGGGVSYMDPPPEAFLSTPSAWTFSGDVGISDAGSSASEITLYLPGLNQATCLQINQLTAYGSTIPNWNLQPSSFAPYAGVFNVGGSVTQNTGAKPPPTEFCGVDNNGQYYYFKVLLER